MTETLERIARDIERHMNLSGWDQPPSASFYKVRRYGDPHCTGQVVLEGKGFDALVTHVRLFGHPDCDIIALHNEAWTYPMDVVEHVRREMDLSTSDPDRVADRIEEVYGYPSEHPRRVEMRVVSVMDRAGNLVAASRRRDTNEVQVLDSEGKSVISGRLVQALRYVMGVDEEFEG